LNFSFSQFALLRFRNNHRIVELLQQIQSINRGEEQWTVVDEYITDLFVPFDHALDAALQASADAGLPPHHITPNQGKLLAILAQVRGTRSILEIGTLGGYSTIWLARSRL